MGNSLDRSIGNTFSISPSRRRARSHWRAQRAAPGRGGGRMELATMIERPEQDRTKVKAPYAVASFLQAKRLSRQHLANERFLAAPANSAVVTYSADLPMIGVYQLSKTIRIRSRRRLIDHARRSVGDRLVWPFLIVGPTKGIKALLLGPTVRRRRQARISLKRAMHPFMAAVLRRSARRDALRLYSELDPPYRQLRQAADATARKWRSIVAADCPWQAKLAESRFQQRSRATRIDTPHRLTTQQISAVSVADRQRVATLAITGTEPSFVIDTPAVVGASAINERRSVRRRYPPAPARYHQSVPAQNLADRARHRPGYIRIVHPQTGPQLARSPRRMLATQCYDSFFNCFAHRMRMMQRRVRPIQQAVLAFGRIARQPLIAGLATDPEMSAQRRHGLLAFFNQSNKPQSLGHGTGLFPRHRQGPPCPHLTCYPSSRSTVLPIIPVRTGRPSPQGGGIASPP
jgi:hypothetical protein